MFYTFTVGGSRFYGNTMEQVEKAALQHHMQAGIDLIDVTVYELLTDRIVRQRCDQCRASTVWTWETDRRQDAMARSKQCPAWMHVRVPLGVCTGCGSYISRHDVDLTVEKDPLWNLAMLFEVATNYGFNSRNLQSWLLVDARATRPRPWQRWTIARTMDYFTAALNSTPFLIVKRNQLITPEMQRVLDRPLTAWMAQARLSETQVAVADANFAAMEPR